MLKTVLLTAALIAPNATETTAPAPEETAPVIIQDHETTEEATAPTVEETPAPVEEQTTETAPTVEEAPTAAATEETPATPEEAPTVEENPETPPLYATPEGLTETAPTSDDTFSTPEEEYLNTVYDPEEVVFHSPEEETPETIQLYETPEELYLQWLSICATYEEYTPAPAAYDPPKAPTAAAYTAPKATAPETAINAPYFNRKPYQGITIITCEY